MRKCRARHRLRGRPTTRALAVAALAAVSLTTASCRDAALAFGPNPTTAAAHADQLFEAYAHRFENVYRDHKFDVGRELLAAGSLVPSRVFDDTSVWSVRPTPVTRTMFVEGLYAGGRYQLLTRPYPVPVPNRPAASRHVVALTRLDKDEFVWDTDVDFALGSITADDIGALIGALLAAPEHRSEAETRADVHAAFPRTAAAIGRYVSIDTIHAIANADGSTTTTAVFLTDPERLRPAYPALADYLTKYANPMRLAVTLADAGGVTWVDLSARDRRFRIRWRSLRGRLLPLYGPARQRPDTLRMTMDFTAKVGMFTVGVKQMKMDLALGTQPHSRGWTFIARKEPDWVLPLASEHLIRTSLRHPFEGSGIDFRIGVDDSAGTQTILVRRLHMAVQEGAILRFLAKLGSHAVNEFDQRAEREEERFLHDAFVALQADESALVGR